MIAIVDIKKAVNNVLRAKFPDIELYSDDTKKGFKRPAFFTQIVPITSNYETINYMSHRTMIVINYFSKNGTDLENLRMDEDLRKAFGMTLKVNQRSFLLQNIRSEIVDEALQFRFDLHYLAGIEKTEEHEVMKELNINLKE